MSESCRYLQSLHSVNCFSVFWLFCVVSLTDVAVPFMLRKMEYASLVYAAVSTVTFKQITASTSALQPSTSEIWTTLTSIRQRGSGAGFKNSPASRLQIQGNCDLGGSTEDVDNGLAHTGFAADDAPRTVFPLAVGCPVGIDQRDRCVGEDVEREADDGQGAEEVQ